MNKQIHKILTVIISTVWMINGLLCKVLNLVPRHEKIVARILGEEYALIITRTIGVAEVCMSIWIFTGIWSRLNAVAQMLIIAIMNILECLLAPDLLLWGRMNLTFATLFILLIYYNEFYFGKKLAQQV